MTIVLTVLHVMVCLFLISVVLLQRGKGAEIGAVFGGGASSTVFGSRGAGNFLTKLTTAAAVVFMGTSLALAYLATSRSTSSLFDEKPNAEVPAAAPAASPFAEPAAPAPAEGAAAAPADTGAGAPSAPPAGGEPAPAAP